MAPAIDMPEHRDDGRCHEGCWQKALLGDAEYTFLRDSYLNMADEFDPMGTDPRLKKVELEDFDPLYVDAAREYSLAMRIPLPWSFGSIDLAAIAVTRAERREVL